MNKSFISTVFSAVLVSTLALSGCSKEEEKKEENGEASFKVQLKNSASALNLATTSLTAKLGGVDLIADCAGDQPPGNCLEIGRAPDPDIWVNAGCNNDIAQCTTANTEFFELIDPTATNAVLNSQGRTIEAGTFTKVRLYFLNNDANDAVQCNGEANAVRPQVPITIALPAATVVADGESVTVTLVYDPTAVDCANAPTIQTTFAAMTATVTKI